jgi:hypothetical protein
MFCFTSKRQDGSCADVATALNLSPWATLALRVSLMILTRITWLDEGRSLKVTIGPKSCRIRVSRHRQSPSIRSRETQCLEEAGFLSTGTIPVETAPLPADASSYLASLGNGLQP